MKILVRILNSKSEIILSGLRSILHMLADNMQTNFVYNAEKVVVKFMVQLDLEYTQDPP